MNLENHLKSKKLWAELYDKVFPPKLYSNEPEYDLMVFESMIYSRKKETEDLYMNLVEHGFISVDMTESNISKMKYWAEFYDRCEALLLKLNLSKYFEMKIDEK